MFFRHNNSGSKNYTNKKKLSIFITKPNTRSSVSFSNSMLKTRKTSLIKSINNKSITRKSCFKMFIPSSKNRQCGGCGRH